MRDIPKKWRKWRRDEDAQMVACFKEDFSVGTGPEKVRIDQPTTVIRLETRPDIYVARYSTHSRRARWDHGRMEGWNVASVSIPIPLSVLITRASLVGEVEQVFL